MPDPSAPHPRSPRWLRIGARLTRTLIALGMIGVSIGIFAALRATRPVPERTTGAAQFPRVVAISLEPVEVARVWPGHGQARAMRAVELSTEIAGRVRSRAPGVEEGVLIPQDQPIVQLDTSDLRARELESEARLERLRADRRATAEIAAVEDQLEAARQDLSLQVRELDRVQRAVRNGAANETDIDRQQAAVQRATREVRALEQTLNIIPARLDSLDAQIRVEQAALETARRDIDRATVRAPFPAVVERIDVEVGQWIPAGTTVASLVDLSTIEVQIRVPVSASGTFAIGDRVELVGDSDRSRDASGYVSRISPVADEATRSLPVYVEIAQDLPTPSQPRPFEPGPSLILPGQYLLARVHASTREQRLIVPRRVITDDAVYVVETESIEGTEIERARKVPVQVAYSIQGSFPSLDPAETQWAVIADGLEPGQRVIVSNLAELYPGRRILSAPPAPAASDERRSSLDDPEPKG